MNKIQHQLEQAFTTFGDLAWGLPLLILLLGGGIFFSVYSRFIPFKYLLHAIDILRGKYDDADDPGEINHFAALASALSATIGMGNIAGVAVAISMGGPGAIFWMWISAIVGMATKFFTCTLSILYRGKDNNGNLQGGPMYVIREGMSKKFLPLAKFFALAGIIGCGPFFASNQLTATIKIIIIGSSPVSNTLNWIVGIILASITSLVIFGGIKRIAKVATKLVPSMVIIYVTTISVILIFNAEKLPLVLTQIFSDAFSGDAVAGGILGSVIITGIRRGAFSNEAGIGTESMAHGAAKTSEPIREGLVAMLGPAIDTLLICSMTAFAILITDSWKLQELKGVALTTHAFDVGLPAIGEFRIGKYLLLLTASIFSLTTIFTYSYYGGKCLDFLAGSRLKNAAYTYNIFYIIMIVVGAVFSLKTIVGLIDGFYALMAIPTMVSTLYLAPVVMQRARIYFEKLKNN